MRYVSANSSLNDYTKTGQYFVPQDASIRDTPYRACPGWLSVSTSGHFIKQEFVEYSAAKKKWMRATDDQNKPQNWFAWTEILTTASLGDGLRITNGKLSVPEMQGATASAAGTSGLVPPATAGQHESFLTGGGEYKPALTKISDSVSLEDSKTAASAKAVKTAYDLANSKLPISGGTITGGLTINGGLESHQNINLTSDEANGLAIALYNTSNAILSLLRFKNNLITVEKGVFSADGVYSRGNMQLRTDDSNGLAIALYDLDGVSLYNSVRLKKDGTVSLEFQPLDISQVEREREMQLRQEQIFLFRPDPKMRKDQVSSQRSEYPQRNLHSPPVGRGHIVPSPQTLHASSA